MTNERKDKRSPVSGYSTGYQTGYETGYQTGYETGYQTGGYSKSEDTVCNPQRGFAAAREQIAQQYKNDEVDEVTETSSKELVKAALLAQAMQGNFTMFNDPNLSKDKQENDQLEKVTASNTTYVK